MDRRALLGLAAVAAAAAPAKASSGGGEAASGESYFRLPVVTATLMLANGRRGVLSIETGVDVPDAALRARVRASGPRLRSAYNEAAQRFASGMRPGMPPDVDQLAAALQAATNAALGRAGARLLLGTVMAL
ncbi:Tat pathway signal protein [Brevundimonas nasdae]|uniref:Tat pathway signal protein n=1 Tax=Brevundimonas nasdae TaxID=172043 RepID=UPI00289A32B4|nr:Tat pathway signal protein [Brevundimonas nasdae]